MKKYFFRSFLIVSCLILWFVIADAEKVLILTYSYNRPDFIEWQHKTFEKFLLDDYDFVVFNDASNPELSSQIEAICNQYNISCVRVPQNHVNNTPGARHQDAIKLSLETIGFKYDGLVCMFDGDMFLVQPFSIINFMKDYDLAALPQSRENDVHYLFPGLVFMDMRNLPNKETINWAGGYINGSAADTGGQMHYYLKNNSHIRLHYMNQLLFGRRATDIENAGVVCDECKKNQNLACSHNTEILKKCGLDQYGIKFLQAGPQGGNEFFMDGHFFHYRCASWDFSIDHNQKTSLVSQYMNDLLYS